MKKKFHKSAVSVLLCFALIVMQIIPLMVSSAKSSGFDEDDGRIIAYASYAASFGDAFAVDNGNAAENGGNTAENGDNTAENGDNAAENGGNTAGNSDNTAGSGAYSQGFQGADISKEYGSGSLSDPDEFLSSDISDPAGLAGTSDAADLSEKDAAEKDAAEGASSSSANDEVDKAFEDSDLERPQQDAEENHMLTPEEGQAVLDRVKENLSELSGNELSDTKITGLEDNSNSEEAAAAAAGEEENAAALLEEEQPEEQTVDISWYTPEDVCFTLTSAAQLKGLALLVSSGDSFSEKTVALGSDIDMTDVKWTLPVGSSEEHPFAGTFDGAGYEISGFALGTEESPASLTYSGFFGYLEGTVLNLKLEGSILAEKHSGALYTGGLAGFACNAEIHDVTVNVNIEASSSDDLIYAGGFFGAAEQAEVEGAEAQGSLKIKGASNNRSYAGGIAGRVENGGLVVNSGSTGEIEVSGQTAFAGGLAGYLTGREDDALRIHNDYRSGNMTVTSESGYAGGLLGYAGAYTDVQNCYTSGKIRIGTNEAAGTEQGVSGLLAGSVYDDAGSRVSSCYSLASAQAESGDSNRLIGEAGEKAETLGNRLFKEDGTFEKTGAESDGEEGEAAAEETVKGETVKTEMAEMSERTAELFCCETLYEALNLWVIEERAQSDGGNTGSGADAENAAGANGGLTDAAGSEARQADEVNYWIGSGINLRPNGAATPSAPQEPAVSVLPEEAAYRVGQTIGVNDAGSADGVSGEETDAPPAEEEEPLLTEGSLRAEISENPDGSGEGSMTFQWYRCTDETGTVLEPVQGAADAFFAPPTDTSGEFYYRLCAIYRADAAAGYDIAFSCGWSRVVKVTVGYTATYSSGLSSEENLSGSLPAGGVYAAGKTIRTAAAGDLSYTGYYLRYWTTRYTIFDEEENETVEKTVNISPGDSFVMPESDVTLTALWAPKTGIVFESSAPDFEYRDAITGEIHADGLWQPGEEIVLPDQGVLKLEGYQLTGWYDSGTGKTWKVGDTYEVPSFSTTLYGIWAREVKLRFTAEEGITGEAPADIETVEGAVVTMPECTFDIPECEESGYFYRFEGWKLYALGKSEDGGESPDENAGDGGESPDENAGDDGENPDENAGDDGATGDSVGEDTSEEAVQNGGSAGDGASGDPAVKETSGNTEEAAIYKAGSSYLVTDDAVFLASFKKVASWNGSSAADSFGQGAGSTENPYIIETAEQLAKLAQDVNGLNGTTPDSYEGVSFRLGADIDLNDASWTPIGILNDSAAGAVSRPFAGYFDGAGYTISYFKVDQAAVEKTDAFGLFGYVVNEEESRPAIQNLKIEEAEIQLSGESKGAGSIEDGDICAGLIVGYLKGSMSNCEAAGSVTVTEQNSSGEGSAGEGSAGEGSGDGSSSGSGDAGTDSTSGDSGTEGGSQGASGAAATGEPVSFTVFSGGLAGYVSDGNLTQCVSAASVSAERQNPGEAMTAGGIAGYGSKSFFTQCTNTGNVALVTGSAVNYSQWTKGTLAAGGIAGQIFEGAIENCENTGKVAGSGSDILYVGGIAGYAQAEVKSSDNTGEITTDACYVHRSSDGEGSSQSAYDWDSGMQTPPAYRGAAAGGITGYTGADLSLCVNTGAVKLSRKISGSSSGTASAVSMAGGLSGGAVNGTISDSYNAGSVELSLTADSTVDAAEIPAGCGYGGGLVGISGFCASDAAAAVNSHRGETLSYVHNVGQVAVNCPDSAETSEKQTETSAVGGTLAGRCACETEINDAYSMEDILLRNGSVTGSEKADPVDFGDENAGEDDREESDETKLGEALIGDSSGAVQTENVTEASKEQFGMGEIAYLLDGGKEARNVWTQSGGAYPVLGTPHLGKVTTQQPAEGGSVSFRLAGMSTSYETFYAPPGAAVLVEIISPSEGRTVYADWTTSVESEAGTTYYRYNSYYGYALFGLGVIFSNNQSLRLIDLEFGIDEGRTFEMPEGADAAVYTYFDYGYETALIDRWFVPKEEEPVEPEPPAPDVKENTSSGGKVSKTDGRQDGGEGSEDGAGGNHPEEKEQNENVMPVVASPDITISDEPQSVPTPAESALQQPEESALQQPAESQEQTREPQSETEPEMDASVPDGEQNETPEEIPEDAEEPEEVQQEQDMTMFEVIQNTIKASPGLMLLMLFLFIILIAVGGYSRYRKNSRFK